MTRYRDAEGRVHSDSPFGTDVMLCGDAREGESGSSDMTLTTELINCRRCAAIIMYSKQYRQRDISGRTF